MRIPADHYLFCANTSTTTVCEASSLTSKWRTSSSTYLVTMARKHLRSEFNQLLTGRDTKTSRSIARISERKKKGKTCDELFTEAVQVVVNKLWSHLDSLVGADDPENRNFLPDNHKLLRQV